MLGRGKSARAPGANHHQLNRLMSAPKGVPKRALASGKVFRKNAGRPWNSAKQLG